MEMDKTIVFKYATRSRPEYFERGLQSILENLEDKENYFIIVSCDENDVTMLNSHLKYAYNDKIKFCFGHSRNKVDAINRDLHHLPNDWGILVNMSDDMVFIKQGFDNIIRNDFAGDADLCLHYPDGYRNDIITMSILGRNYFHRFYYIYSPNYISLWCDDEQTQVAKILNKYKFVDNQLFIHKHFANDSSVVKDAQYQHTESYYSADQETFRYRKSNNFFL
jgi:hypothetical protein